MMHSRPAEPQWHQKRTVGHLSHNFSPISTCFKTPIFKEKKPCNSCQLLETSNHSEQNEKQQTSSPLGKTETTCLKQGPQEGSGEVKVEQHNLTLETSTVTTTPSCKKGPPSGENQDDEDEDQTLFFTPELFEGEEKEGSPQGEINIKSPIKMESPALLSEELLYSKQRQGEICAFEGQNDILVSKGGTELSVGQEEEISGQKQGDEGEEVDDLRRQTHSRLCKLSRSRQIAPSTPTGN